MIANSHLDPVWLWQCQQGYDEAINTMRTTCNLIDEYPELIVTRGDAWVYNVIKESQPDLFQRIKTHVENKRIIPVNGCWVQPDCNFPTKESFIRNYNAANEFYSDNFGIQTKVGYAVDSFGHNGMIPSFLRECGLEHYVFMRPGTHEMKLPDNLFVWESLTGDRVIAARIPSYLTVPSGIEKNVMMTLFSSKRRDFGICFFGVGDHGGGPTKNEIEWILKNKNYMGNELVFSHPQKFFDTIKDAELPVHKGELQYHAIGCYSVLHSLKKKVRQAENLIKKLDHFTLSPEDQQLLKLGEKKLLFTQFHDILGGSSLESSCDQSMDDIGMAISIFRDLITKYSRIPALNLDKKQKLVVTNTSSEPYEGYAEFEPWFGYDYQGNFEPVISFDEKEIPHQIIPHESAAFGCRIIFPIRIKPKETIQYSVERVSKWDYEDPEWEYASSVFYNKNSSGITDVRFGLKKLFDSIEFEMIDDDSDTWSHDISKYNEKGEVFKVNHWNAISNGILRGCLCGEFVCGNSTVSLQVISNYFEECLRLKLRVNWREKFKLLKMNFNTSSSIRKRLDGCQGNVMIERNGDQEYPIHNMISFNEEIGIVSQDVYSADVIGNKIRLTLLRSPIFAHDKHWEYTEGVHFNTDQGIHEFELAVVPFKEIWKEVEKQTNPLIFREDTSGMSGADNSPVFPLF